jgi:aspartyl-tRNA(Asn)/glutamyl-tRNA(Gln) amidotransferase subunit B
MEEGSLRCDANVSVRPVGQKQFGTKAEVKNVNSFRYLQKALEYEIARQTEVLQSGGRVVQETRLWDQSSGRTVSMRSKEEAHDYRYFPEPDLPPVEVTAERIASIQHTLPELAAARRARLIAEYAIPEYDAAELTRSRTLADFFEATARVSGSAKAASNWIMGEISRKLKELGTDIEHAAITPDALAGLIALIDRGTITSTTAKDVFEKMYASGESAEAIVGREGLAQISDESSILEQVLTVIASHADAVAQYRSGQNKTFGFLVGQVMKATAGKASPKLVNELLRRELDRR